MIVDTSSISLYRVVKPYIIGCPPVTNSKITRVMNEESPLREPGEISLYYIPSDNLYNADLISRLPRRCPRCGVDKDKLPSYINICECGLIIGIWSWSGDRHIVTIIDMPPRIYKEDTI